MFHSLQSHVYDHAWRTKTRFNYGNFMYVGVLPDTTKNPRGVPHTDQEVNYLPSTISRFNSSDLIQLGTTLHANYPVTLSSNLCRISVHVKLVERQEVM